MARVQGSGSGNTEHPGPRLRVTFLRARVMASFQPPQGSRILESSLSSATGEEPVEYKSLQWFGATVRAHGSSILVRDQWAHWWLNAEQWWRKPGRSKPETPSGPSQACAPLYSWRTEKEPQNDPVGTCYLSTDNFTRILEYAPCRSGRGQSDMSQCAFFMRGCRVFRYFSSWPPTIRIDLFKAVLPRQHITTQLVHLIVFFPHRFRQRGRAGLLPRGLQC